MNVGQLLFRESLGEVLRAQRLGKGLTLRELSAGARVSLGYISEIERGHKEASSELLSALCNALDVRLSEVLHRVSQSVALEEQRLAVPSIAPEAVSGDVVASAA